VMLNFCQTSEGSIFSVINIFDLKDETTKG